MKQIKIKSMTFILLSRIVLLLWMIVIPILLQAKELKEYEVRAAVETWVRYITAAARPDAVIEKMEPYQVERRTVAYIAHLLGGGFCLCGADDLVLPVYLYNPHGTYDLQNPNYQYILWEITTRLNYLQEGISQGLNVIQVHQKSLLDRTKLWQDLINGHIPNEVLQKSETESIGEPEMMELDLTCQWGQGYPYNNKCPSLTPTERTVVGCGGIAQSQLMYYWKWPKTGSGMGTHYYPYWWRNNWDEESLDMSLSIPNGWQGRLEYDSNRKKLRINGYWDFSVKIAGLGVSGDSRYQNAFNSLWSRLFTGSTPLPADYNGTDYHWELMADRTSQLTPEGIDAVSTLCYQVAVAQKTGFGVRGSGSGLDRVESALEDNFRYDGSASFQIRDVTTMISEIQWLRPIIMQGTCPAGGHAWVIYGYKKTTNQFRMNMGWDGSDDGWYTLDNVPLSLNYDQAHLINIAPFYVVKFVGNIIQGDGSPINPYLNLENALSKAPDGATLIFKAGSDNTFYTSSLVINRPFILKGYNVTIRKQ
jgi:hypothetical protein